MTHNVHLERDSADPRVQRTHQAILDALIELTIEKGFANVTVRDITQRARINRATFYRHYQDKFDLLERYYQAVYDLLDAPEAASPVIGEGGFDQAPEGLTKMLEHIRANATFYRVMLGKNGDPAFAENVRAYTAKRLRRSLPDSLLQDRLTADLCLSYMSSAAVGAVQWWLEHDLPYTPKAFAAISYRMSAANIRSMLEL